MEKPVIPTEEQLEILEYHFCKVNKHPDPTTLCLIAAETGLSEEQTLVSVCPSSCPWHQPHSPCMPLCPTSSACPALVSLSYTCTCLSPHTGFLQQPLSFSCSPHIACTPLCPMCSLLALPAPPCTLHTPHCTHKSPLHLCNPQHIPNCTQSSNATQHLPVPHILPALHMFLLLNVHPVHTVLQTISDSLGSTNYCWF